MKRTAVVTPLSVRVSRLVHDERDSSVCDPMRAAARNNSVAPVMTTIKPRRKGASSPSTGPARRRTTLFWHPPASSSLAAFGIEIRWRGWKHNVVQVGWSTLLVLRNACISVAFTGVVMLSFSRGDIFSGRPTEEQSSRGFAVSILLWAKLFHWLCVTSNYSVPLMAQRFPSNPDARPKFVACWKKLLRGTYRVAIFSTILTLATGIALTQVSDSTRKTRLQFYASVLWYHFDTVGCNIEATRIYREELFKVKKSIQLLGRRAKSPIGSSLRGFSSTSSDMSSYYVSTIFTHITSTLKLTTSAQLLSFMFALKIGMQEIAKYSIFKQKVQSVATMAATVGIPTILIDTQMRVVLLRAQSTSMTLSGTLAMAAIEISLRCSRSFYVKYKIKREKTKRSLLSVVPVAGLNERNADAHAAPNSTPHSEYVALGCLYVVVIFCWNHPKYMLSSYHGTTSSSGSGDVNGVQSQSLSMVMGGAHAIIVGSQLGAEVFVDYISCLLEIGNGINFQPLQRQGFFLAVLLIWAATGNAAISTNTFLQV